MRIFISGTPRSGKSTLANEFKSEAVSTDQFKELSWEDQKLEVVDLINNPDIKIIEGVTVVRALRKWLDDNEGKPCDLLIWMDNPKGKLSRHQETMSKSLTTIMEGVYDPLLSRGVDVVGFGVDEGDEIYVL